LVIASLISLLGVPSVVRGLTRLGTDFQGTTEALARGLIGSATATLPGQPMTAEQVTQAVAARARAGVAAEHGLSFAVVRA
jgi:hypothetical protein